MNYQLIQGDCLDVLPTLETGSVDVVITSPPYNMRTRIRNGQYTTREWSDAEFSTKYTNFHDAYPIDEYYKIHESVIAHLLRVAKVVFINIQIVTGSKEAWFSLIGKYAKNIKDVVVWDKGHGQPSMHPSVLNKATELILILESSGQAGRAFSRSFFDRGSLDDIWRIKRTASSISGHSAVFPEQLVSKILDGFTLPNDTVLDPFMGSGTTGVTAMRAGRKFIGIELDAYYFSISKQRIQNAAGDFVPTKAEEQSGQMAIWDML